MHIYIFTGWGAHHSNYGKPYMTAAAAIGMKHSDVDTFIKRLDKVLAKIYTTPITDQKADPHKIPDNAQTATNKRAREGNLPVKNPSCGVQESLDSKIKDTPKEVPHNS